LQPERSRTSLAATRYCHPDLRQCALLRLAMMSHVARSRRSWSVPPCSLRARQVPPRTRHAPKACAWLRAGSLPTLPFAARVGVRSAWATGQREACSAGSADSGRLVEKGPRSLGRYRHIAEAARRPRLPDPLISIAVKSDWRTVTFSGEATRPAKVIVAQHQDHVRILLTWTPREDAPPSSALSCPRWHASQQGRITNGPEQLVSSLGLP